MTQQTGRDFDGSTPEDSHRLGSVESRRLHNLNASISKLSDDVLSYIFMLNTEVDDRLPHVPSTITRYSSQVIKRWRDIALNYSVLWATSLDFSDTLPWIREVIKRAGSSPVTLTFPPVLHFGAEDKIDLHRERMALSSKMDDYDERFELALSLCSRAKHVALRINDSVLIGELPRWRYALTHLTKPSPHLQTFSLFQTFAFGSNKGYTLPDNLFDGQAPMLRSLKFVNTHCHFNPHLKVFHNLSTLHISSLRPGRSAADWLRIIASTPDLVNLTLESSFLEDETRKPGATTDTHVAQKTVLPRLRMLTLKGAHKACSVVFTHLTFPPSCGMDIVCFTPETDELYHAMMNSVQRKLAAFNIPDWRERGISVECNAGGVAFSNVHQSEGLPSFSFRWTITQGTPAHLFSSFISTLRHTFPDISDLHLNLETLEKSHSVQILRVFNKVQQSRISQAHVFSSLLQSHKDSSSALSVILPSLTKLSVYQIGFSRYSWSPLINELVDLIYLRSDLGKPIEIVKFTRCPGFAEHISELAILGVEVDWDGWDGEVQYNLV